MNENSAGETESRIDKVALRKALGERVVGNRLLYFLTVDSTNEHVRELAEDGWPEGTVVLAEEQSAGRGRAGRSWHSPAGVGLYFSVLLKPPIAPEKIPLLTLMAAVAGARALREAGHDVVLKWPNDLLLGARKIGGILAEARLRPGTPAEVVLGMGLNVNHGEEDFPAELRGSAGSLRLGAGKIVDRTDLLARLLARLDDGYAALRAGGEAALVEEFESLCPMIRRRRVSVTGEGEPFGGESAGLSPLGSLRVVTPDGVREVRAADVSVVEGPDAPRG